MKNILLTALCLAPAFLFGQMTINTLSFTDANCNGNCDGGANISEIRVWFKTIVVDWDLIAEAMATTDADTSVGLGSVWQFCVGMNSGIDHVGLDVSLILLLFDMFWLRLSLYSFTLFDRILYFAENQKCGHNNRRWDDDCYSCLWF